MDLAVSASNLGVLLLEKYCPRCLWFLIQLRNTPPLQHGFPGIFNDIDRHTKRVVTAHIDDHGKAPAWLGKFASSSGYIDTRMRYSDSKSGLTLTGEPDALLTGFAAGIGVLDYKTARFTKGQDALLRKYDVQLNAYRYLIEHTTEQSVSDLALIYCEPQCASTAAEARKCDLKEGFNLSFVPRIVPIELKPDGFIEGLLAKYGSVADLPVPPEGRQGCYDCGKIDSFTSLVANRTLTDARLILCHQELSQKLATFSYYDCQFVTPRAESALRDRMPTMWTEWSSELPVL